MLKTFNSSKQNKLECLILKKDFKASLIFVVRAKVRMSGSYCKTFRKSIFNTFYSSKQNKLECLILKKILRLV
jgi:hypothetical protein